MSAAKTRRLWSSTEISLLKREAAKGLCAKDIAKRFPKHTPLAVRIKLIKLGGLLRLRAWE
jgi:hypothetical protein